MPVNAPALAGIFLLLTACFHVSFYFIRLILIIVFLFLFFYYLCSPNINNLIFIVPFILETNIPLQYPQRIVDTVCLPELSREIVFQYILILNNYANSEIFLQIIHDREE